MVGNIGRLAVGDLVDRAALLFILEQMGAGLGVGLMHWPGIVPHAPYPVVLLMIWARLFVRGADAPLLLVSRDAIGEFMSRDNHGGIEQIADLGVGMALAQARRCGCYIECGV